MFWLPLLWYIPIGTILGLGVASGLDALKSKEELAAKWSTYLHLPLLQGGSIGNGVFGARELIIILLILVLLIAYMLFRRYAR